MVSRMGHTRIFNVSKAFHLLVSHPLSTIYFICLDISEPMSGDANPRGPQGLDSPAIQDQALVLTRALVSQGLGGIG